VAAAVWKLLGVGDGSTEGAAAAAAWDVEFAHAPVPAWKRAARAQVADMDIHAVTRAVLSVLTHTKNPPCLLSILGTSWKPFRNTNYSDLN